MGRLEDIKKKLGVCLVPTTEAIERASNEAELGTAMLTCHEYDVCNCDVRWLIEEIERWKAGHEYLNLALGSANDIEDKLRTQIIGLRNKNRIMKEGLDFYKMPEHEGCTLADVAKHQEKIHDDAGWEALDALRKVNGDV